MTPSRSGVIFGLVAGVLLAILVLVIGVNGLSGGVDSVLDALTGFLIGAIVVGPIAAFVQSRRLRGTSGETPPPGWYDSPEDDGTQWYWSGSTWTDRTRATPPRVRHIESGS